MNAIVGRTDEAELFRAAQAGCKRSTTALVERHKRFAFKLAKSYLRFLPASSDRLEELNAEGLVGLLEAIKRFDPDRGFAFTTYSSWWIKSCLRKYTIRTRRIVPLPQTRTLRHITNNFSAMRRKLTTLAGPPSQEELAKALGCKLADLQLVEATYYTGVNDFLLDEARVSDSTFHETIDAQDDVQHRLASIAPLLDLLTPRERYIVEHRFIEGESLGKIGDVFGLSRERVRQIENQLRAEFLAVAENPAACARRKRRALFNQASADSQ